MDNSELVIFETKDRKVSIPVLVREDTVWLTQAQMTRLFDVDRTVITRHVNNVFKEGELDQKSNVQILHIANSDRPVQHYNLDVIISVGYRIRSKRGIEFRKWANGVLKQYILQGYAVNDRRMEQLGQVITLMKRIQNSLDSKQVLSVIESYSKALNLLDGYDHQALEKPEGRPAVCRITYEECRQIIDGMGFGVDSALFGKEKDDSFKGSIGAIYQSFGGEEVYPSLEEKAANLLYFVTKNHSFVDGNKRIAATMFLYFLGKNGALFSDGKALIDNNALAALTIMIAESNPEEKELMIRVIINCLR